MRFSSLISIRTHCFHLINFKITYESSDTDRKQMSLAFHSKFCRQVTLNFSNSNKPAMRVYLETVSALKKKYLNSTKKLLFEKNDTK